MFQNAQSKIFFCLFIGPVKLIAFLYFFVHFLKFFYKLISFMGPNFLELFNNSIVNFEKSCLRKIEFQRNFLVEIRQSIMKLLSLELTFENVK